MFTGNMAPWKMEDFRVFGSPVFVFDDQFSTVTGTPLALTNQDLETLYNKSSWLHKDDYADTEDLHIFKTYWPIPPSPKETRQRNNKCKSTELHKLDNKNPLLNTDLPSELALSSEIANNSKLAGHGVLAHESKLATTGELAPESKLAQENILTKNNELNTTRDSYNENNRP